MSEQDGEIKNPEAHGKEQEQLQREAERAAFFFPSQFAVGVVTGHGPGESLKIAAAILQHLSTAHIKPRPEDTDEDRALIRHVADVAGSARMGLEGIQQGVMLSRGQQTESSLIEVVGSMPANVRPIKR